MNKYIYLGDYKIAPYNPDKDGAYLIISNDVIEVVKEPTHSWEINQILVEDVDFFFSERHTYENNILIWPPKTVAVPISKPNTDVKDDDEFDLNDLAMPLIPKKRFKATMINVREVDEHGNAINPVKLNTQYSEQNYSKGEGDIPEDFEKITGFKTPEAWNAYQKGIEDNGETMMEYIAKWDGYTNSHFGQAMADAVKRVSGERLYSKEEINSPLDFMLKIGFEAGGNGLWIREVDEKGKKNEFKFYTNKQVIEWYNNQKSNQ